MAENKKRYRSDRTCESCGAQGAALVSEDVRAVPLYLCKTCMRLKLNHKMTVEELITVVEKHWGIEADSRVSLCPKCKKQKVEVVSIDGTHYFSKCACGTIEHIRDVRFFRF